MAPLDQFFGLAHARARLLGRPVDVVERGAVRNPFVLAGINEAREVVYAAQEKLEDVDSYSSKSKV